MNGKSKCKILKDIRKQIAQDNDIAFVTSECKYQGDCTGTCPKCEAEVFFLEQELEKRRKTGKKVVLAGIAAATIMGIACCGIEDSDPKSSVTAGAPPERSSFSSSSSETEPLMGEEDVTEPSGDELMGEPIYPPEDELQGDLPLFPEQDPTEESKPPLSEQEPGIDTGDWGDIF